MMLLLLIIENVNAGSIEDDIPPMKGGSAEVNQVYNSFAKLFKIVRVSNSAFFSGNLKWASHFLNNALQLFRKVDDKKAIGIACNNLGNTILAIYCERATPNLCCKVDGVCLASRGKELLDEAIKIGTQEFDKAKTDDEKADFAQQLANRRFNRALLLLLTQDDPCAVSNSRESGYADIVEARHLDDDVVDYWLQKKLMLQNSAAYFERLLRRLRGLVDLSSDGGHISDVWDARELVEDLDRLLFAAWDQPNAPLFRDVSRIGRLQQLEDVVIQFEMSMGNVCEAAGLAIRMMVEDEYILESAFLSAANALLAYMKLDKPSPWSSEAVSSTKANLRTILKSCKGLSFDAEKCLVLCLELSNVSKKDSPILSTISQSSLLLYDEYFNDDDYISAVSLGENVDENLTSELSRKGLQNRARFELATKSTCGAHSYPTIPIAIQMLADKAECRNTDVFVVAVVDESSWGSLSPESIRLQIDQINRKRNSVIHIIIVGLDLTSKEVADACRQVCMVSKASKFLDATEDNIDSVFDQVLSMIAKHSTTSGNRLGGITIEKF
jgi:hypothetical protein